MALTGRDIIDQPIPNTNLNLLPATLPTHPFSHNFLLTGAPWNLSLIIDYTPAPHRPLTDHTPYSTPKAPSPVPTPSTVVTRPHPAPTSNNRPNPPAMRPTPQATEPEWRYSDPQPVSIRTMVNP
eukprot:5436495-Amphidinium_carterae.1